MYRIVYSIAIVFLAHVAMAQQVKELAIGKAFQIHSQALAEEREYWVSLPGSYENDEFYIGKHYPVLIVLDAAAHFQTVSSTVRAMSVNDEQIPEMIIVGIPNTNRQRDLTPATSAGFIRFLETELLPIIDKNYRTIPYRLLAGHSMGGLFATQCFLQQQTFNSYLVIDPTLRWNDNAIIREYETVLAKGTALKADIYIAQAANPFQDTTKADLRGEAFQKFVALLKQSNTGKLRYRHEYFPREDHYSTPTPAFYYGLLYLFEDYKFPLQTLARVSALDVARHYETFSKRCGVLPPGKLLDQAAQYLLQEKKTDTAIGIMKLNETYYPASSVPYYSLGRAFRAKGDTTDAIRYFKMSLQRNANNESAKKAIAELSKG